MPPIEVTLEQDNANDEDAVVTAIHVVSGALIAEGASILDVETSKAVQEVSAPASGVVTHCLNVGDRVGFGAVLFQVTDPANEKPHGRRSAAGKPLVRPSSSRRPEIEAPDLHSGDPESGHAGVEVTARARALMEREGLTAADVGGRFITVDHVRRHLAGAAPTGALAPIPRATPTRAAGDQLSVRKQREIQTLSRGAGSTMLSVIGASLGRVRRLGIESGFFADRVVDIVAYEASRLMRRYPRLNAAYQAPDGVRLHPAINVGVALDDGESGLVLYSIKGSDSLPLTAIQDSINVGLERYVLGELTSAEMGSATFSLTDLSPFRVDYVLPLLPSNQSAIIGITSDGDGGFRLYVGFDHRLTEGREVSLFLTELVARVKSFDVEPPRQPGSYACDFCGKLMEEETGVFRGKGLLSMIDRNGDTVLCCHACFSGF